MITIKNQNLYDALREYCRVACAYLSAKLRSPEDLPTTIGQQFKFTGPGEFSHSYVPEVQWFRLIEKHSLDFGRMDVYQKVIEAMKEDIKVAKHLNTLVGTAEMRIRVEAPTCLRRLLTHLLHEQDGLDFDEFKFDKLYEGVEDYFYRDTVEYRYLAPLHNFRMEGERLELSPKFSIIKIPKQEREEILSYFGEFLPFGFPLYQARPFDEYAFEFYYEVPKIFGNDSPPPKEGALPSQIARKEFDEACSALRLFKSGATGYDYIRIKPTSWAVHVGAYTTSSIAARLPIGTQYTLSNEEVSNFLKFWDFFKKVRQKRQNRIEIAIRRFNFGYERARPEDKLIDWMIAFEALFLGRGGRQELEYRLALRGSTLIGKEPNDREKIFNELKEAYRQRSNIVHGDSVKPLIQIKNEKVQFNEFVNRIEEHLRSVIKEFLAKASTQSELQVLNSLDKRIIRGV
jgi:hypothetical protein